MKARRGRTAALIAIPLVLLSAAVVGGAVAVSGLDAVRSPARQLGSEAAEAAGRDFTALPDLQGVEVTAGGSDGPGGDHVAVTLRPGTPPDRIEHTARAVVDRLRRPGVSGVLVITRLDIPAGGIGIDGPGELRVGLPVPAGPAADDALRLWLALSAEHGAADVTTGTAADGGGHTAALTLPLDTSPAGVVEAFRTLAGTRAPGAVPVRWSLQTGFSRAVDLASAADLPPAALGVVESLVAATAAGAPPTDLRFDWVTGPDAPARLDILARVRTDQHTMIEETERIVRACRERSAGSPVPFALRVEATGGRTLLELEHR